jgi:hypothetical protein
LLDAAHKAAAFAAARSPGPTPPGPRTDDIGSKPNTSE